MIRYLYDELNVFTRSIELTEFDTWPVASTLIAPPPLVAGEFAIFDGASWDTVMIRPIAVPQVVTMRQARLALLSEALLDDVDVALQALTEPNKSSAIIEWEYSQTVERNRPFVALLGDALGLNDTQLDDLFILAATL